MSINTLRAITHRSAQRGDTIVEVLISVAIISLVLAGAYAITTRNLTTTQDTQEHGEALQIAQQQIEGLRALSPTTNLTAAFPVNDCVTPTGTPGLSAGNACKVTASGSACGTTACYQIKITQPSTGIYEVTVTWGSLKGGNSSVAMEYGI